MINKIEGLEFHIKSQDYFGTLAAVLSLSRQNLIANADRKLVVKVLESAEEQLVYLQENYKIVKVVGKV